MTTNYFDDNKFSLIDSNYLNNHITLKIHKIN